MYSRAVLRRDVNFGALRCAANTSFHFVPNEKRNSYPLREIITISIQSLFVNELTNRNVISHPIELNGTLWMEISYF